MWKLTVFQEVQILIWWNYHSDVSKTDSVGCSQCQYLFLVCSSCRCWSAAILSVLQIHQLSALTQHLEEPRLVCFCPCFTFWIMQEGWHYRIFWTVFFCLAWLVSQLLSYQLLLSLFFNHTEKNMAILEINITDVFAVLWNIPQIP